MNTKNECMNKYEDEWMNELMHIPEWLETA